jgi:hypothetical protein
MPTSLQFASALLAYQISLPLTAGKYLIKKLMYVGKLLS